MREYADSQKVVQIVQHGSGNPALQAEALAIFSICVGNHIHMEHEWLPREQNQLADYYTRPVDSDNYMLNPTPFGVGLCNNSDNVIIMIAI